MATTQADKNDFQQNGEREKIARNGMNYRVFGLLVLVLLLIFINIMRY
jgi:hypothetical protein